VLLLLLPLVQQLLLFWLLLWLLLLATCSAGFRCGPVSDAESLRASYFVKAQDVAQKQSL
jgi:hypothetical protein